MKLKFEAAYNMLHSDRWELSEHQCALAPNAIRCGDIELAHAVFRGAGTMVTETRPIALYHDEVIYQQQDGERHAVL